jgi:KDO2-lipid IV(A) lauroyltransferase
MAKGYSVFRYFGWLVSKLPWPAVYFVSSMVRLLLHRILRYRRDVVLENLRRSFPDKSPGEIRKISNLFYRNLADISLEVMKLEGIDDDELLRRFHFNGYEILETSFSRGRSVIVAIGHCGNWEWMGTALGLIAPVKGFAVVKPLSNPGFHRYIEMLRHRLNPGSTIPFRHTFRVMARNRKEFQTFNVIASDQTPLAGDIHFWHPFLHQETPFFQGVERLARSLDFDVVFIDIYRTGRGRYNGDIYLITDNPGNTQPDEITRKYIGLLEASIRCRPDNWLWSHRRWKHKKPEPGREVL